MIARSINFGASAVISAKCQADSQALVSYATPAAFSTFVAGASVNLTLTGVAPSCVGHSLTSLCASKGEPFGRPGYVPCSRISKPSCQRGRCTEPLVPGVQCRLRHRAFFCLWVNEESGGAYEIGPLHAGKTLYSEAGVSLGWHVSLLCPIPPDDEVVYGATESINATLKLSVVHRPPSLPAREVGFEAPSMAFFSFVEAPYSVASGGTVSVIVDDSGRVWMVHTFLASGTFTWVSGRCGSLGVNPPQPVVRLDDPTMQTVMSVGLRLLSVAAGTRATSSSSVAVGAVAGAMPVAVAVVASCT